MELQKKLDGFRANFELDIARKTTLDNEAVRVRRSGVEGRALKAGQRAPEFALPDMAGLRVSLAQLRADGPVALIFYRGLWWPYCNMEQLALQEIYPAIRKMGAQRGEGRPFPVLWDEGNRVADMFGLKHDFSPATRDLYKDAAVDLENINGTEAGWTLPLASTYIIDKAGMIRHAVVTVDWRVRPDPNDTLQRLTEAIKTVS